MLRARFHFKQYGAFRIKWLALVREGRNRRLGPEIHLRRTVQKYSAITPRDVRSRRPLSLSPRHGLSARDAAPVPETADPQGAPRASADDRRGDTEVEPWNRGRLVRRGTFDVR